MPWIPSPSVRLRGRCLPSRPAALTRAPTSHPPTLSLHTQAHPGHAGQGLSPPQGSLAGPDLWGPGDSDCLRDPHPQHPHPCKPRDRHHNPSQRRLTLPLPEHSALSVPWSRALQRRLLNTSPAQLPRECFLRSSVLEPGGHVLFEFSRGWRGGERSGRRGVHRQV